VTAAKLNLNDDPDNSVMRIQAIWHLSQSKIDIKIHGYETSIGSEELTKYE